MKTKLTSFIATLLFMILMFATLHAFAATSYTPHYNLAMPAAGDVGWATSLNTNAEEIDEQLWINQNSITDHIDDTTDAHAASAITTTEGTLVCFDSVDVQSFLECLDSNLGALTTGAVVTLNTDQTITGQKTFTTNQIFLSSITLQDIGEGLLHADSAGVVTSSLLVDADIDAAAAISRSKLAAGTNYSLVGNDASGALTDYTLLDGEILIGSTGGAPVPATITGTASQIVVTPGSGSITLSLPQSIGSGSSPTFSGLTITGETGAAFFTGGGALDSEAQLSVSRGGTGINGSSAANGSLLIGNGTGYSAATLTGTSNQVTVTNGAGTVTLSLPQNIATSSAVQFGKLSLGETVNVATGVVSPLALPSTGIVVFTAAVTSLSSIAAASNDQLLIVTNSTGATFNGPNLTGSAGDQIITGTGETIELANGASLFLYYSLSDAVWYVVGGAGGGGGVAVVGTRASPTAIVAGTGFAAPASSKDVLVYAEGSGGPVTLSASPQIAAGVRDGQEYCIRGRTSANSITMVDGNGLNLNGPKTLNADDELCLKWDTSQWVETNWSTK
jgi:hypothetical protein